MEREFIKELAELYVDSHLKLPECLEILASKSNRGCKSGKKSWSHNEKSFCNNASWNLWKVELLNGRKNLVKKSASFILNSLKEGNDVSNAFRSCPFIRFEENCVCFIELGEKIGDLKKVFAFLNQKLERKAECRAKIVEASVYPVFVLCLAIAMVFLLFGYGNGIGNFSENEFSLGVFLRMIFFLLLICGSIFFGIVKILKENTLYEGFLAMDFLINSGGNVSAAVGFASQIVGLNSKIGRKFCEAKEKLELGMNYKNAFDLGNEFEDAFYFADKTGEKNKVFGNIAQWILKKDERRKRLCLSMIEPVFLCVTGVFILILLMNFVMPVFAEDSLFQF